MKKNKKLRTLSEYFLIALGSCIYAVGFLMFLMPNKIPLGGVVGVSMILNSLIGVPVGLMNILINAPLILAGYKILGKEFFFKTAFAIIVSSVAIDAFTPFVPAYQGNLLLATLYGGIVLGFGFGMVFRSGGTSGGSDVLAKLFNRRWSINIGTTNLVVNAVVIAAYTIIYGNMESALYAIIATYLTGTVIDNIIFGGDIQKNAFIITDDPVPVSKIIMDTLHHGVTLINGTGMYTGEEKQVLMTVVRRHETSTLKKIISETDASAFVILSDVSEVFGNGFKQHEKY